MLNVTWNLRGMLCLTVLGLCSIARAGGDKSADLWVLKPVVRPEVPAGLTQSGNPIDAFVAAQYKARNLTPVGPAEKRALLRRVYLDLIGLPPTPAEQDAFLQDESADAYEKIVDRLLASDQHGVRYARHWLDVLRYADVDERMIAAPGIYLWRDWIIHALNDNLPYDQFVRTQLTGYRSRTRTQMSATGQRSRMEPQPQDMFALGLLARGEVIRDGQPRGELAIAAVETISTAFMGLTVGCAKCHDHMYDPIKQRDFYSMKALFDPLVVRKVLLGTPTEIFASGKAIEEAEKKRAALEGPIADLIAPYKKKLYDDRVAMLPPDVQVIILKPESQRSADEQKIADDYFPVLRIDSGKIMEIMPEPARKKYQQLQSQLGNIGKRGTAIPAFWTVEVDPKKELEKSYVLTSGDTQRPEKNHEVSPGWPLAPPNIEFREGRIEAFSDWLTAPENPMFARVAMNRLWQWHFGEGLQKTPSDFGTLGGMPSNPKLLDWLASEFVARGFDMKQMHRLIVTSDTYKLASEADAALAADNIKADSPNTFLWHFRLQRLEAEPIWDSIFTAADNLDVAVGGPSFSLGRDRRRPSAPAAGGESNTRRRAAYMVRGYATDRDVVPTFLAAFDVDDGRAPCPLRTATVVAPQSLFLMNSDVITQAATKLAERLKKESRGDLDAAVDLAYRITLTRPPSRAERARSLSFLAGDSARLKDFAWLLFNLDEFIYVR
jgi:hypothetical protein